MVSVLGVGGLASETLSISIDSRARACDRAVTWPTRVSFVNLTKPAREPSDTSVIAAMRPLLDSEECDGFGLASGALGLHGGHSPQSLLRSAGAVAV